MAKDFSVARKLVDFMNMNLGSLTANELIDLEKDLSVILHFGFLSLLGAPASFNKMQTAYNQHVALKKTDVMTQHRSEAAFSTGAWLGGRTEEFITKLTKIQMAFKNQFAYIETVLTDEALNKTSVDTHRIPFRTVGIAEIETDIKLSTRLEIINTKMKKDVAKKQEELKQKYSSGKSTPKNFEAETAEFNSWSEKYEIDSTHNAFICDICVDPQSNGHLESLICLIFNASLHGIYLSAFKKCESCGNWFVHVTKKKKVYCSNRCATREGAKKRRKFLAENYPEKLEKIKRENSLRGRKSYEKKIKKKYKNAKPARRPSKYKNNEEV